MWSDAFALVLALALAECVAPAERKVQAMGDSGDVVLVLCYTHKCLLSGSWRSDSGCRMVVSTLGKDGRFSGSYLPGPVAGESEILSSPLEGSQQDAGLVPQPTFTFSVHWQLQDSVTDQTTVFLGQCYVGTNGEEILHALWLMREAANSPTEDWKATRVGTSIFTRIK